MVSDSLYGRLVRGEVSGTDLAEEARPHLASNGLRQIAANSLQGVGDQVVNAKTVLPWLLTTVGAPGVLLGLLVPVRESGSMLPQAPMQPWLAQRRRRAPLWVLGAAGQAVAVLVMAVAALTLRGVLAGAVVMGALAGFAAARALCSLAGKDVLGRTVPKGHRGQVNGIQVLVAGFVAIVLGVALQLLGRGDVGPGTLGWLLVAAAVVWLLAGAVYAGVREPTVEPAHHDAADGWVRRSWTLVRDDPPFRRFVTVRALLMVSALSPPFVVALAVEGADGLLTGLGPFVLAQGVASMLGGRVFGRWADRSSRRLMVWASLASSVVLAGFLGLRGLADVPLLHPATYLLLALVHVGARVARKTYVVDLAGGERRTEYIAVSNSVIGVLLLGVGAVSGGLALLGHEVALVFLAVLGVLGAVLGARLPEVERG